MVSFLIQNETYKPFRLYVEQVYSKASENTIIAGSVYEGNLYTGDAIEIKPADILTIVTGINNFDQTKSLSLKGELISINIGDIDASGVKIGSCISHPGRINTVKSLYGKLYLLKDTDKNIINNHKIRLQIASLTLTATVELIKTDILSYGQNCFAKFILDKPLICDIYDKIILLNIENNDITGMVEVLNCSTNNILLENKDTKTILELIESNKVEELIMYILKDIQTFVSLKSLFELLPINSNHIINSLITANKIVLFSDKVIKKEIFDTYKMQFVSKLEDLHKKEPYKAGFKMEQIVSNLNIPDDIIKMTMLYLINTNSVLYSYNKYALSSHKISIPVSDRRTLEKIYKLFKENTFIDRQLLKGLNDDNAIELIIREVSQDNIITLSPDIYILPDDLNDIIAKIKLEIRPDENITPAKCRDAINSSRKYVIPLLEYLDKTGITIRRDDFRQFV